MRFLVIFVFSLFLVAEDVYELMRSRWLDLLANTQTLNSLTPQEKQKYLNSLDKHATKILNSLLSSNQPYLFSKYPDMKNGENVMKSYNELAILAKALITPNSQYYHDKKLKEKILSSLHWLYHNAYKEGLPEYGNWWHWEIGIPKALNEVLALMYPYIPQKDLKQYLQASMYFQPLAKYSGSSPTAKYSSSPNLRISTGGNRMDTSIISFQRGILLKDKTQVLDGIEAIPEVGEYVKEGDGFYSDGSFIQHSTVPYNGTYASVLLEGLAEVLCLSKNTPFELKDNRINNIYQTILNSYSFLFINGGITDAVSGRSISRDNSNELTRGRALIKSLAIISEYINDPYRFQFRSMLKTILEENSNQDTIKKTSNLKAKIILKDIQANQAPLQKEPKSKIFYSMDRVVHHGKEGAKFVLSMHSSRIANYESMNNENKKGWYSGDGMVYIYDKDSSKSKDFWATVDPYYLSGTTESIAKRVDSSGQQREFSKMTPRSFAGGVSNSKMTYAGMDFLSWNGKTSAKKSWFFYDDTMIAMGSNISSTDGEIHTTVSNKDSRNDPFIYQSSNPMIQQNKEYIGNWKDRGGHSQECINKPYKLIYINHGKNPKNATYFYTVSLNKVNPNDLEILSQNQKAHALRIKDVIGIHFWQDEPYEVDKYKSFSTLSLLAKEDKDILELWVSDPTQSSKSPSILQINGKYQLLGSSDPKIRIENSGNKTTLKINNQLTGATHSIKLKKILN